MRKPLRYLACAVVGVALQAALAAAPDDAVPASKSVQVLQLRNDTFLGPPDGPTAPSVASSKVDKLAGIIDDGVYTSPYHGYRIRIPALADATRIELHQSIISRRPDGTPITSHVLFATDGAFAAVVVTRLREDRPKDTSSILAQFEPASAEQYPLYEQRGVTFRRMQGPFGTTLQRSMRGRVASEHFPYRTVMNMASPTSSVGVSRYAVDGNFIYEFSIVLDAKYATDPPALQARAERELDALMAAMVVRAH